MSIRAFDFGLVAVLLITPIFLGSVFLLIDIPILNPVSPLALAIAVLGLCLGLLFGLFTGRWFTKEQFKIFAVKNKCTGLDSKKLKIAFYGGLAVFLVTFLIIYFEISALVYCLILFVISAMFILSITRVIMVSSWEKRERKKIIIELNKGFIIAEN